MTGLVHAVRLGARRGWTEFALSLRSSQDQTFYLMTGGIALGYLWLRRDAETGTDTPFVSFALPGVLAALLAFGLVIGPAYQLAMEKEDGTLLRHRAIPGGMVGYFSGSVVTNVLNVAPQTLVLLVPPFLLFDGLMADPGGWWTLAWVLPLSVLALLPIGLLVGAVVPGVQKVGTWGILPVMVVAGISGIFSQMQALWGWAQTLGQVFPLYWTGLGLRSAFLPDTMAAAELGGSWRPGTTALVLGAWAIVGILATPSVLRRTARRQTGSAVAAARESTMQWTR